VTWRDEIETLTGGIAKLTDEIGILTDGTAKPTDVIEILTGGIVFQIDEIVNQRSGTVNSTGATEIVLLEEVLTTGIEDVQEEMTLTIGIGGMKPNLLPRMEINTRKKIPRLKTCKYPKMSTIT